MPRAEDRTAGPVLWSVDGRKGRAEELTYRESYRATYRGPYTRGKETAWDGLVSNKPGMLGNDPVRGFDLTMPAGEAVAGSYTTRDLASAPHGHDYRPHHRDWERDSAAHPNLVFPGRTAVWSGVRLDVLALGDRVLGTGGCCVQDWLGLDFETMERHGNKARSEYAGGGFAFFDRKALLPRVARLHRRVTRPSGPFSTPRPGVAPLYLMYARNKHFLVPGMIWIDPGEAHEFAFHWAADGRSVEFWVDGELVLTARQGQRAIPAGRRGWGRVEMLPVGLHMDCWQDNGAGGMDVTGAAGHPDVDQVYTVERLEIRGLP